MGSIDAVKISAFTCSCPSVLCAKLIIKNIIDQVERNQGNVRSWIALWFGLYQWVSTKNEIGMPVECFYKKRTLKLSRKDRLDSVSHIRCQFFNELKKATSSTSISESQSDVNQLIKNYSYKLAFAEDQYLYLLLFVADTLTEHETTQHSGIYSNSRMTVVDLRRALPSVFLRPGAQHGWTVKMNSRNERIPAFTAGQQPRIAVLGLIAVCGPCLPLE